MGFENRNILLFLDNAGAYLKQINLKNLRHIYRTLILKHLLVNIETADSSNEFVKKNNLLVIPHFNKTAWDQVINTTTKNYFGKTFHTKNQSLEEDEIPFSLLAEIYKKKVTFGIIHHDLQEFFNIDQHLIKK